MYVTNLTLTKQADPLQLASVGLDVFMKEPKVDERLISMPHITLLPHIGTENRDARRKMEVLALTNLRDYLVTGKGLTPVPECA